MANKRLCLGILVMVLVFGMTVVGCDNGSTKGSTVLDGTWTKTTSGVVQDVSIKGSDWSVKNAGRDHARGTITLTDPNATTGSVKFTVNESWDGTSWVAMTIQTATANYAMGSEKTTVTFSNVAGSSWFNTLQGAWTKK